jgi:hypothetical protein
LRQERIGTQCYGGTGMTFSRSRFPEFFSDSQGIKMHLKFEDKPLDALPIRLQEEGKIDIKPAQLNCLQFFLT